MSTKNSESIIEQIKTKLGEHRQSGQELVFQTCPYCGDAKGHFYLNVPRMLYHCFKCNAGGGEYTLARYIGLELTDKPVDRVTQEVKELAFRFFADQLASNPTAEDARNWLQERGIDREWLPIFETGDGRVPKRLPIGYHPGDPEIMEYLEDLGYEPGHINKAGILLGDLRDFSGSIVFIYHISSDKIGRLKLRRIRGSSGDTVWLGKKEGYPIGVFGFNLFDWSRTGKNREAVCVEGEFDCLSLQLHMLRHEQVTTNVVALSGGAAGKGVEALSNVGIETIRVVPDNDPGGVSFVNSCLARCRKKNMKCVVHQVPEQYKDPDEWARSGNLDLRAPFGNQMLPGQYLARGMVELDETFKSFNLSRPDGMEGARRYVSDKAGKLRGHDRADFIQELPEEIRPDYNASITTPATRSTDINPPEFTLDKYTPPKGFLLDYLNYMLPITEAPPQFHIFGGLMMIATVIGQRAYFVVADQHKYLNLWVVLIGSSGCKKSTSINSPRQILANCGFKNHLFPTQVTPERLIQMLQDRNVGTFFWSEWGSVMDQWNKSYAQDLMSLFTDLYDGGYFSRWLKAEKYEIMNSSISLFCACTPAWLKRTVSQGDVSMGYWPRFLFVPARRRDRYMPNPPKGDPKLLEHLEQSLAYIQDQFPAECPQEVDFSAVEDMYASWYVKVNKAADEDTARPYMASFVVRLCDYAKKTAALIEISSSQSICVKPETMHYTLALADWLKDSVAYVMAETEKNRWSEIEERVFRVIEQSGSDGIQHADLRHRFRYSKGEIDTAISSLEDSGDIKVINTKPEGRGRPGRKYIAASMLREG